MKDNSPFMVFDVESIGLHGLGFAVGWVVIDREGVKHDQGLLAYDARHEKGDPEDKAWVAANVPPLVETCYHPVRLRACFWKNWMRWRKEGAVLAADCPWPVEANFLSACIADDLSRKWDGPYPLIDVASVSLAAGLDPLATCPRRFGDELPVHNPLSDAMHSAWQLIDALRLIRGRAA